MTDNKACVMRINIFTALFASLSLLLTTCANKSVAAPNNADSGGLEVKIRDISDYLNNRLAKSNAWVSGTK